MCEQITPPPAPPTSNLLSKDRRLPWGGGSPGGPGPLYILHLLHLIPLCSRTPSVRPWFSCNVISPINRSGGHFGGIGSCGYETVSLLFIFFLGDNVLEFLIIMGKKCKKLIKKIYTKNKKND